MQIFRLARPRRPARAEVAHDAPRALVALALAAACGGAPTPGFSTGPGTPSSSTGASESSGGGSAGGPGGSSTSAGSSTTIETTTASTSEHSTTLILDVGGGDVGSPQPEGCKGKIDFLFVISRAGYMDEIQDKLVAAFPGFIETIQTKFADFDYHIMVVDGDPVWGSMICTPNCPVQEPEPNCVGYPCDLLDHVSVCDATMGAGTVFNAGWKATNHPCDINGGRRYLTRDQPDLSSTFECIARVGLSGYDLIGDAMVQAVSPGLNGPGGCNEGFLRDDALLVVTLVSTSTDNASQGTPPEWAQAVVEAKGGDLDAVVMFGIGDSKVDGECQKLDTVCQAVAAVPWSHWTSALKEDYAPGFDVATGLVEAACAKFIPQ